MDDGGNSGTGLRAGPRVIKSAWNDLVFLIPAYADGMWQMLTLLTVANKF